jgi:hypothetical protein
LLTRPLTHDVSRDARRRRAPASACAGERARRAVAERHGRGRCLCACAADVPGNHDMWIRPAGQHSNEPAMFADSVQKLISLWQMCDELDVDTGPAMLSPHVTVVPLDAWYSCTFDHFDPRPGSTLFDKFCKWPMHYDNVRRTPDARARCLRTPSRVAVHRLASPSTASHRCSPPRVAARGVVAPPHMGVLCRAVRVNPCSCTTRPLPHRRCHRACSATGRGPRCGSS